MAKRTADITGTNITGATRLALALAAFAAATPPLMAWQALALRAPFLDERLVPRLWHRMVVRLLGLRVRVHGAPALARPLLIAANHVSWTDIMALGAATDVHFIAKAEVSGWPLFGRLAKLQRTVFIDRTRRGLAGDQAGEIAARLARGEPMVLFPEGTTSDGNTLLPFKSSLFAAAQMAMGAVGGGPEEDAVVQPVAIVYTRLHGMPMSRRERMRAAWIGDQTLVPHLAALLRQGGIDVEVHFGEPVAFGPGADRKAIAREVEARVRAMMLAALRGEL